MKKIFLMLLLCVLLLCVLVSCGDGKTDTSETDVNEKVVLYDTAGIHCRLAYPDQADSTVISYVEQIQTDFKNITGVEPSAYAESKLPNDGCAVIYFGDTTAAEKENIISDTGYYNYSISVRNNNVYIYSMDKKVLTEALMKFSLNLQKYFVDGNLILDDTFAYEGTASAYKRLSNIPYFDNGIYHSTHDCDNGYEMILIEDADATEFNNYCEKIQSKGYTMTAENQMNGNLFRTYFNDKKIMLHTYFIEYAGEVRVIVADDPAYCDTQKDDREQYQSLLVSVPLYGSEGGMGYIFRLGDGSFIIVDSGMTADAEKIYGLLKRYAPDPQNIVISTWVITHGHADHVWGLIEFAKRYSNDPTITVKSFMHNMCLTEEQTEFLDIDSWEATITAIKTHYPSVPVYIPLTGQVYNFSNAQLEIFFTMPDYMPKTIQNEVDATPEDPLKGNGNIQSLVFRISINGKSVFIMADTTKECCDEMSRRFGSYLESDYVQMAHHGIEDTRPRAQNATKEIYGLIKPDYALLPLCASKVANTLNYNVNQYLVELLGGKDKVISAGDSAVVYF